MVSAVLTRFSLPPTLVNATSIGLFPDVEARTADGDRVLLHPNGRWVFVDQAKAAAAAKVADTFPENHTRPIDAQGGWLGVGRLII